MPYRDLREFLDKLEKEGEMQTVRNADWNLEIGGLTELMAQRDGPALMFDEIKDYPRGYRVVTNAMNSFKRGCMAAGAPTELKGLEVVQWWRERMKTVKPIPPREVTDGPIMENIQVGEEINLTKFPTPFWHELDGGRYIGTGCLVITRDPDGGWVNAGTYRVQLYDEKTVGLYISPGHHGRIIMEKYHRQGQNCPVVVTFGQDPVTTLFGTYGLPYGTPELDVAGGFNGEPLPIIRGEYTGLPIPATAEIALEGEVAPPEVETKVEGPFGEWTGYYGAGSREEPVIRVKAVFHRNNPIMLGMPPLKPPLSSGFFNGSILLAATLWSELEASGVPGVKGVWLNEGAYRMIAIISIKQLYGGHAKQVGLVATGSGANAYLSNMAIVVDEDIDPTDIQSVLWAVATRCDPETSVDIVRGCWGSALDPRLPPDKRSKRNFSNSRIIIDACKPYYWKDQFPATNEVSAELKRKLVEKWKTTIPKITASTA